MAVIENFAALSVDEQREFAEALIKTINTEKLFSDEITFSFVDIEADERTGDLGIGVSHGDSIDVPRDAIWQVDDEDDAERDPGYEAYYDNNIYEDAKKIFKTLSAEIEGYIVSIDVADVDEGDTVEVIADKVKAEDSGIGYYEYSDTHGYDSHPYFEVEGTIVKSCDCVLAFFVEPKAN